MTECTKGHYGSKCVKGCSKTCVDPETCEKKTGHCNGGCQTDWIGELCNDCKYKHLLNYITLQIVIWNVRWRILLFFFYISKNAFYLSFSEKQNSDIYIRSYRIREICYVCPEMCIYSLNSYVKKNKMIILIVQLALGR